MMNRNMPVAVFTASLFSMYMYMYLFVALCPGVLSAMTEEHRLQERKKRGWEWPLKNFVPDTLGWRKLMERRFEQVSRIEDRTLRYNGWTQTMNMAAVQPNFTENGWGLTRAPPDLVQELVDALHAGLPTARPEANIDVIFGDEESRPLFVQNDLLNRKVLDSLRPMHEEWAGVPLRGALAYGLRAYRNSSSLLMHVDKSLTHIISCILHIDHSEDSEPWPIIIEDFQGNTNEVVLTSGDMLFYESSKCIHGRPRNFTGSWYSSIFVHYYPTNWDTRNANLEGHYAVPPHWSDQSPPDPNLDELVVVGTGFHEPKCQDMWCALSQSVKWHGPAKEGVVMTTGYDPDDPTTWRTDGAWKGEKDGGEL